MCRANTLHLCSQCLLLPLALTSDSFLAALGLKTKVRVPKHCKHIYSINAWTVLGEPDMDHVRVGLEVQRAIPTVMLAFVIFVAHDVPCTNADFLQGIWEKTAHGRGAPTVGKCTAFRQPASRLAPCPCP